MKVYFLSLYLDVGLFIFQLWLEMKYFIFRLWDNNSKVKKQKFGIRVGDSKWNSVFEKVELVPRKRNFCKNVRVSTSKCHVILGSLIFVSRVAKLCISSSRIPNLDHKHLNRFKTFDWTLAKIDHKVSYLEKLIYIQ